MLLISYNKYYCVILSDIIEFIHYKTFIELEMRDWGIKLANEITTEKKFIIFIKSSISRNIKCDRLACRTRVNYVKFLGYKS